MRNTSFVTVPFSSSLLTPIEMIDNQADTIQCFSTALLYVGS